MEEEKKDRRRRFSGEDWRRYIRKCNENDEETIVQAVPDERAEAWIEREAPFFECPDPVLEETWYFRWWVLRKHIKETAGGRIITEFLPQVPWAGPYNSINSANGHHIAEAAWLRNDKGLVKEYIVFWLRGEGDETSYSSWIADAVYRYALAAGEEAFAVGLLDDLVSFYEKVEASNMTKYGLFWSYDDRDAMEMSISGSGLRPTLNSYMCANAAAIARIADWAGEKELQERFEKKAETLKSLILKYLWDEKARFFKVIPLNTREDEAEAFSFEEIPAERNVREEIGYIPWCFSIPDKRHDGAWEYLKREDGFRAPFGITTAERSHPLYRNTRSPHECQWNGPVWPYATTQTLDGMIRLLQERKTETVNKEDFLEQLRIYAESHQRIREDGKRVNWLDENLDPETGEWLARKILQGWGWPEEKGGYERGKDYNHSAFCDLVIRGLCGVCPEEGNVLVIDPLLPENTWDYFLLEELPCMGHLLTIVYDRDGSRYKKGSGFWVEEDGQILASREKPGKLRITLEKRIGGKE